MYGVGGHNKLRPYKDALDMNTKKGHTRMYAPRLLKKSILL